MKHVLTAVASVMFAATAFAAAPKAAPKSVTLKGEVVDTVCYLTKGAHGAAHKACAQACIKGGTPASLLADGKLYLLVAGHGNAAAMDQVKAHAGDTVTVTGQEASKDGLSAIIVASVK